MFKIELIRQWGLWSIGRYSYESVLCNFRGEVEDQAISLPTIYLRVTFQKIQTLELVNHSMLYR